MYEDYYVETFVAGMISGAENRRHDDDGVRMRRRRMA